MTTQDNRADQRLEDATTIERGARVTAAEFLENRPAYAALTVAYHARQAQSAREEQNMQAVRDKLAERHPRYADALGRLIDATARDAAQRDCRERREPVIAGRSGRSR